MHRFKDSVFADIIYQLTKNRSKEKLVKWSFSCATHVAQAFPDFDFKNSYYLITKEAVEKWEENKLTLLKARQMIRSLRSLKRESKDKASKELIKAFEQVLLTTLAVRHAYLTSLHAVKSVYYRNIDKDYIFEIEKERVWQLQVIE